LPAHYPDNDIPSRNDDASPASCPASSPRPPPLPLSCLIHSSVSVYLLSYPLCTTAAPPSVSSAVSSCPPHPTPPPPAGLRLRLSVFPPFGRQKTHRRRGIFDRDNKRKYAGRPANTNMRAMTKHGDLSSILGRASARRHPPEASRGNESLPLREHSDSLLETPHTPTPAPVFGLAAALPDN